MKTCSRSSRGCVWLSTGALDQDIKDIVEDFAQCQACWMQFLKISQYFSRGFGGGFCVSTCASQNSSWVAVHLVLVSVLANPAAPPPPDQKTEKIYFDVVQKSCSSVHLLSVVLFRWRTFCVDSVLDFFFYMYTHIRLNVLVLADHVPDGLKRALFTLEILPVCARCCETGRE